MLYGLGSRAPIEDENQDDYANAYFELWVAYAILPWLSVGAELRHQHFLDQPRALAAQNAANPALPQQEYQTTLAGGARFRIPVAGSVVIPLGVSYARGLNGWMDARDHNVFQLDIPVAF